jgi:hypothetical protein
MDLEIFTVATEETPGFRCLMRSLDACGFAPSVLGLGLPVLGLCWKFKQFIYAARASAAATVLFADGYDTICLEPAPLVLEKFRALGHPIVFSFEHQARPEFYLALNSGLIIADRLALVGMFPNALLDELFPNHFNDQLQLQLLWSWHPDRFRLDTESRLFYSQCPLAPDLVLSDGRFVNPRTGLAPSFVHGPGRASLRNVCEGLPFLQPQPSTSI